MEGIKRREREDKKERKQNKTKREAEVRGRGKKKGKEERLKSLGRDRHESGEEVGRKAKRGRSEKGGKKSANHDIFRTPVQAQVRKRKRIRKKGKARE